MKRQRGWYTTDTVAAIAQETFAGCLVATGMPGAGRTTVTTSAPAALPRAARLDGATAAAIIACRADERTP